MALHLTNAKYCAAVSCPKKLWLQLFRNETFDRSREPAQKPVPLVLFREETRLLEGPLDQRLRETTRLLQEEVPFIGNAALSFRGLFCQIPLLQNLGRGQVEVFERRAPMAPASLAFSCQVLSCLGFQVQRAWLVGPDSQLEDYTAEILEQLPQVADSIRFLEGYLAQRQEPSSIPCSHCPDCGFQGTCFRREQV